MTYTVFLLSKVNRIEYQDNVTVTSLDCVSAAVLCKGGKVSSPCKFFCKISFELIQQSLIYQFNTESVQEVTISPEIGHRSGKVTSA